MLPFDITATPSGENCVRLEVLDKDLYRGLSVVGGVRQGPIWG